MTAALFLALAPVAAAHDESAVGASVRVYYATNRAWSDTGRHPGYTRRDAESLAWGTVDVVEHGPRLPGQDKPLQPQVPTVETEDSVLQEVVGRGLPVVVIVHGYNTSWDWATREAAQLAMDLRKEGTEVVPLLYSWPSGGLVRYPPDENAASRSVFRFEGFLRDVLDRAPDGKVELVAHSLCARVASTAIHEMWGGLHPPTRKIDQIVLASADVDTLEFRERYLDSMLDAGERTTLYVTINDRALNLSRHLHGGYPRLGETGLAAPPTAVDVIDTGPLDHGATRHSTFRESESALVDLAQVLRGVPVQSRGLVPQDVEWTFSAVDRRTTGVARAGTR